MNTTRIPRRGLRARLDLRLLLGLAIVAASVVGVWWVVQSGRETVPALAASAPLVPGQPISATDVVEIEARLGAAEPLYLVPDALADGLVATRAVGEGELIAASATGLIDASTTTTVVVRSALEVPGDVGVGTTVELWASRLEAPGEYAAPTVVVPDAVVASLTSDDGMVARDGTRLELIVERSDVAAVLEHVSAGSALSAVPVHGGTAP